MSIKETMDGFGREYIRNNGTIDTYRGFDSIPEWAVVEYEDDSTTYEGCPTCGYTDYRVSLTAYATIITHDAARTERCGYATYDGKFSDLLLAIQRWEANNAKATPEVLDL